MMGIKVREAGLEELHLITEVVMLMTLSLMIITIKNNPI
ncbi:MAG: hypothetical protein Ct9H90mP19_1820 [Gammaproteobacteria bacterium]|nr:MAG: hypothetical protein Ct9H90mP19_1820 [Gammaproteobacteria bacterium]